MKHIASFLTVLLSVLAAAAQTAPKGPPPAPAVFVPPKAEEIKTFRSLTDSFSIDFAGRVTESSEKAGQFMIRNYSARRTGTRATVVAYDFGLSEPDKLDREAFLGDLKADLQRIEGTELVSDVAITIDDFNGREIVSKAGYEREITRVLFTDSSIFRLSVFVTNWHILSDEKKTEFEQEKNRFFASFKTGRRFYEGSGFRGEAIRPAAKTISASKVIETDNPRETAGSTFKVGEKNSSPPPPPPPAVLGVDQNRDVKITSSMRAAGSVPGFGTYTQYRAPQKSELKQFVSGAFDFEVVWSGTPGSRKRFIVNGTESVFFTDRFGGGYGVSVSEFSFKLSDVHSENEVFEYIRNRIRQYGVHSIKSEKRIESGGVKGIEFELESPLQFSRMRAFYTGNRIIEVSTSVPLIFFKTVAQSRNIDQFDAECRRFFNSFRLKKTEKSPDNAVVVVDLNPRKGARLPALELPDDEYDRARGRFVSRKGHFAADLPREPNRLFSLIQEESSATELTQYLVEGPEETISIGYFDFPSVPPTKAEKRYQANYQRDFVLKSTSAAVLVGEKDLEYQGHFGRQYDLKIDTVDAVLRYVFVDQRLYKIFFARLAGDRNNDQRREAFLNSISLGEPPPPEYPPAVLPADFAIDFTDTSASSGYFGFSLDFEEAWGVVEASISEEIMKIARAEGEALEGILREEHFETLDNTRLLMIIMRFVPESENPPRISIFAERAGFPNFSPESAVEAYKSILDSGEQLTGNEGRENFDGVEFAWYESYSTIEKTYLRMYIANRRGLRLIFALAYADEATFARQLQILESLRFPPQSDRLPVKIAPTPMEELRK